MPEEKCSATERACVTTAAQIISAKWMPQLLFALSSDVRRFSELLQEVPGINPRTLSARLDELEEAGVVTKTAFAEVPPRTEYTLTEKGRDLLPILQDMIAWGKRYGKVAQ